MGCWQSLGESLNFYLSGRRSSLKSRLTQDFLPPFVSWSLKQRQFSVSTLQLTNCAGGPLRNCWLGQAFLHWLMTWALDDSVSNILLEMEEDPVLSQQWGVQFLCDSDNFPLPRGCRLNLLQPFFKVGWQCHKDIVGRPHIWLSTKGFSLWEAWSSILESMIY